MCELCACFTGGSDRTEDSALDISCLAVSEGGFFGVGGRALEDKCGACSSDASLASSESPAILEGDGCCWCRGDDGGIDDRICLPVDDGRLLRCGGFAMDDCKLDDMGTAAPPLTSPLGLGVLGFWRTERRRGVVVVAVALGVVDVTTGLDGDVACGG